MTRREWMGAATAAGTAWAAGPIRAAVYGTSHAHAIGKLAALKALPQFELAGVCEPDTSVPRTNKALEGVRWLTADEMLSDASIELVVVEGRVQDNLGYAIQAVAADKYVHLDKAPGTDLAAFRKLLNEAQRRKRVVQMGYMWRFQPAMQAAMEAARKGWLGDVYALRARIDKPIAPAERKKLAAFRGGMMFELGCHLIDRATDLLGEPEKVTGYLWHHARQDDALADNTLAVLEYAHATAEISVAAMHPNGGAYRTLEITGTNGSATVRPFNNRLVTDLRQAAGPYEKGVRETVLASDGLPAYGQDFLEMARVMREGAAPAYSVQHDVMTHGVLLKVCGEMR